MLDHLYLHENDMVDVPGSWATSFDTLRTSTLSENPRLATLDPTATTALTNIEYLSMYGCNLTSLPDDFFANKPNLSIIEVHTNPLTKLVVETEQILQLEHLDVSSSFINELSLNQNHLPKLKFVNTSNCGNLTQLESSFFSRPSLETVDVSNTSIVIDPTFCQSAESLEFLFARHMKNQSFLTEEFFRFCMTQSVNNTKLTYLDLSNNNLNQLDLLQAYLDEYNVVVGSDTDTSLSNVVLLKMDDNPVNCEINVGFRTYLLNPEAGSKLLSYETHSLQYFCSCVYPSVPVSNGFVTTCSNPVPIDVKSILEYSLISIAMISLVTLLWLVILPRLISFRNKARFKNLEKMAVKMPAYRDGFDQYRVPNAKISSHTSEEQPCIDKSKNYLCKTISPRIAPVSSAKKMMDHSLEKEIQRLIPLFRPFKHRNILAIVGWYIPPHVQSETNREYLIIMEDLEDPRAAKLLKEIVTTDVNTTEQVQHHLDDEEGDVDPYTDDEDDTDVNDADVDQQGTEHLSAFAGRTGLQIASDSEASSDSEAEFNTVAGPHTHEATDLNVDVDPNPKLEIHPEYGVSSGEVLKALRESKAVQLATCYGIVEALEYLHKRGFRHKNLSDNTVYLDWVDGQVVPKIMLYEHQPMGDITEGEHFLRQVYDETFRSPSFIASVNVEDPDQDLENKSSREWKEADEFALAMIIWEILNLKNPRDEIISEEYHPSTWRIDGFLSTEAVAQFNLLTVGKGNLKKLKAALKVDLKKAQEPSQA